MMNNPNLSKIFLFIAFVSVQVFVKSNLLNAQSIFSKLDSASIKANCKQGCFFITGELHGVASNMLVEDFFSKTLVQQYNVRTILIEEPYTNAYLINKFLETGDTSFLNIYVSDYPMKFIEVRNRILNLYELNKELSASDKIKVVAFDIWENTDTPFVKQLFNLLIDREIFDNELKNAVKSIVETDSFPRNIKQIKNMLSAYNPKHYSADLDSIIRSYVNWQAYSNNLFKDKNRQTYLYENILARQQLFKGNIYGNFGYGHIDLEQKSTAFFLKSNHAFNYTITSYYPYYHHCKSLQWINTKRIEGYNQLYFNRAVRRAKLANGVYLTEKKGKNYIVHVGQVGMQELP